MVDRTQHNNDKELHLIDLNDASKAGCWVTVPVLLFYFLPFYFLWYPKYGDNFWEVVFNWEWQVPAFMYLVVLIAVMVLGIILHELIHGVFWAVFAKKGWKSIQFGLIKEHFTPYCHCTEPLKVKHYVVGGLMPLIILGIIPGVWAWFNGNIYLLLFGFFFTVSAIGDVLVINMLRKFPKNSYVQDHPNEAGFYVYR